MSLLKYKPAHMSWEDIARILNMDRSYLYNMAKSVHRYSLKNIIRLGNIFNLSTEKISRIWAEEYKKHGTGKSLRIWASKYLENHT